MADFQDTLKEKFNSLLSSANSLRQSATETIKEGLETGKEKLQEFDRERRANDIYRSLGRKIYKLSSRGEIELPECCEKFIVALNELYADAEEAEEAEDAEECACEDKKECCCCEDKKECCCAEDNKECCCEEKKDDDADKADEDKKD